MACVTYNHAPFIRQALDGFVMQKTTFPFRAYVADDCSTDGTAEIIKEYSERYPDIIVPIFRAANMGPECNDLDLCERIRSKYVAWCEGDDFWTDENKLQLQFDYLEAHPECSICFHPVRVFFEDGSKEGYVYPTPAQRHNKSILELSDLLRENFIQTNSAVYRWRFANEDIRAAHIQGVLPGDWYSHLLHAQVGRIGFIDRVMACYRRHPGGVWYDSRDKDTENRLLLKYGIGMMKFFSAVESNIALDKVSYHRDVTLPNAERLARVYVQNGLFSQAAQIVSMCPDVLVGFASSNAELEKVKSELNSILESPTWRHGARVSRVARFAFPRGAFHTRVVAWLLCAPRRLLRKLRRVPA